MGGVGQSVWKVYFKFLLNLVSILVLNETIGPIRLTFDNFKRSKHSCEHRKYFDVPQSQS